MSQDLKTKIQEQLLNELENDQLVLPTLPEVALRIRDVVEDEDSNVEKIAKQIKSDAALSARLIQVVNSPLLRTAKKIESLEMAINRMGNKMLRNMVNSIIVQQMFQATTDVSDIRLRQVWEHSTQVAAISHALAQFVKLQPDQALLAGLVHDIGALPIYKYAEDVSELRSDIELLDQIVKELHTVVGAEILKKWNFGDEFVAVAADHENLQRNIDGPADYVDVVIAANLQSYMDIDHPYAKIAWSDVPAFAKLGFDTEVNVIEMDEVGDSVKEIQAALI